MEIADWLRGLSLERYAETFRANAVDVAVLPELTEADLEKLVDVDSPRRGVDDSNLARQVPLTTNQQDGDKSCIRGRRGQGA